MELNESEQVELAEDYHRRKRIPLPDIKIHALCHVAIENQLANDFPEVVEALKRHNAIHAIGSVLVPIMFNVGKPGAESTQEAGAAYLEELKQLTAGKWLDIVEEPE